MTAHPDEDWRHLPDGVLTTLQQGEVRGFPGWQKYFNSQRDDEGASLIILLFPPQKAVSLGEWAGL